MESVANTTPMITGKPYRVPLLLVLLGTATFLVGLFLDDPARAWQSYLINFLLWSAIAQGALLFSAVMHITKARWAEPLASLGEAYAAFFPLSLVLFLILFLGQNHVFPWIGEDLHGKEVWLNIPFLFTRDLIGLMILYLIGYIYLYYALGLKLHGRSGEGKIRAILARRWSREKFDPERYKRKKTLFGGLYILAFAFILSLIGFDLVMSMDPHWFSTLFGAYTFVKAFYVGLGAIIILAALLNIGSQGTWRVEPSQFHDIGKLFFAFCLVWADFFYCQLVVIWYGNISEETAYVIERTMMNPWKPLAWFIFIVCFIGPFLILLKRSVKMQPRFMVVLCSLVIAGIWLEHLLLLGPALNHHAEYLPLGPSDLLITVGFFGLMIMAVTFFLKLFPDLARVQERRTS